MNHCKDCVHFAKVHPIYGKTYTTCNEADYIEREEQIRLDGFAVYAIASDDTGLDWGIKVGPMFGCVKFVSKYE